jgi:uncharacterized protein YndB with AHSA1/START domain
MHAIRHHVGIDAPIDDVYAAVATREGVAGWWTEDVRGEAEEGGRLAFWFGKPGPGAVMTVDELSAPSRVRWSIVEGPDDWVGTTVTFELEADGDETGVSFTHDGWRDTDKFLRHCSTKWGYFMLSLKHGLERHTATPWPHDERIGKLG